jgi:Ca2+-binding EF-hand superfamily protein
MRKTLTVSALALTLATLGAASGHAQDKPAAPDGSTFSHVARWFGGDGDGPRMGRHRHGGDEDFGHGGRGEGRHGWGDRDEHGGPGRDGGMFGGIEQLDLNKDGAVTQDEVDQFRNGQIAKYDADKNGTLSLQEYQNLWLDQMRERMVRAFQEHDADGNGQVTADEFNKRFAGLVERMDRNGDGKISQEDRRGDRGGEGRDGPVQPDAQSAPEKAPGTAPAPATQP